MKQFERGECAQGRVPEVAVASDHYLMFRCPDGCNKNTSIEFVDLEEIPGNGEDYIYLTMNLRCSGCKKSFHYKISFRPDSERPFAGVGWNEQLRLMSSKF